MELGIDISTYFDELDSSAKFFSDGRKVEPMDVFFSQGVRFMRIRLWVDPFTDSKVPYGGGTSDTIRFIELSKIAISHGFSVILDIHYSDFWADPGKQFVPKAWQGLSLKDLAEKVTSYTHEVLSEAKANGIDLYAIQIGNEITNGFLWPSGKLIDKGKGQKRGNYDAFVYLLKHGIREARSVYPKAKIIIHLERSNDQAVYKEFFTELRDHNVDYDVIGASYYPYWHGTFDQFFANMDAVKEEFSKEVMVMEFSYAFTMEDFIANGNGNLVINAAGDDSKINYPYPVTPDGQMKCVKRFLSLCREHDISMVVYWEPCWIPGSNTGWATKDGQSYIHEENKSTRNEWANQCLFDYQGNALPALKEFRK